MLRNVIDTDLQRAPSPGSGVVLTAWTARRLGLAPGDLLPIESRQNQRRMIMARLTATVEDPLGEAGYMELDALGRLLGDPETYSNANLVIDKAREKELYAELKRVIAQPSDAIRDGRRRWRTACECAGARSRRWHLSCSIQPATSHKEGLMQIRAWSWSISLFVALGACGSKQSTPPATATAQPAAQHSGGEEMCPMMPGAGTKLEVSDTGDGVAVAFTTSGDVADLRARVRHMADMHNGMAGMHHGDGMHGGMGSGDTHEGMMGMQMVPSRATAEDIPGGARLVLVPSDPAQLSALRTRARDHVAMMEKGECPMMKGSQPAKPTDEHAGHHPPGA